MMLQTVKGVKLAERRNVARIYRLDNENSCLGHWVSVFLILGKFFWQMKRLILNQEWNQAFEPELVNDLSPKFVVGEIVEMVAHRSSDHLNICQVKVAADKVVQIMLGANADQVSRLWRFQIAMMPKGNLISWWVAWRKRVLVWCAALVNYNCQCSENVGLLN